MRFVRCILVALLAISAACGTSEPNITVPSGDMVVTANAIDGSITMVELSSGRAVNVPVGSGPHEITASPDGQSLVVPLFGRWVFGIGDGDGNQAAVVNAIDGKVLKVVDLGSTRSPHGAIVLDDGKVAVIPALDSNELVFLDVESGAVLSKVATGHSVYLITRRRGSALAYTSSPKENVVIEFEPASREIKRKFIIAGAPGSMALADSGASLWIVRPEAKQISVLDLASGEIVRSFDAVDHLRRIAISPDGSTLIVSEQNEVRVFDAASRTEKGRIVVGEGVFASGVTFGADQRIAYVALSNSAALIEVDVENLKPLRKFATGARPDGVVFVDR
jgi:DNA-binding beta-propeller fold protein YncE